MLTIKFFGHITTLLGCRELSLEASDFPSVGALRQHLAQKDAQWAFAFNDQTLLMAVNHTFCDEQQSLTAGDEVAFFPPVTGG
ncbi:MAG: MoaD/ThiS family protein [Glaciecola sp.]|jgi:molybdopterin synthase sulfur carrier subunit